MGFKSNENCSPEFLDAGQYQKNGILRYERIFGETFVSTGGEKTTKNFVSKIRLSPGMRVLDIGCGTGGSAFYMAKNFGVEVLGVDLSQNMLDIANDHKIKLFNEKVQHNVSFRLLNATLAQFPEDYFDVIYSRDAIMHISEKKALYSKVFTWLKPGGQLLVSEYVHGKNYPNFTQEYIDYIDDRGYQLVTVKQYGEILERVGFTNVSATDLTNEFIDILKLELEKFKPKKAEFVKEFSLKDYNELVDGWEIKIVRCSKGEQGWGLFSAAKKV